MALLAWAACSHFTQGCPHPTNSRQVCQASQASQHPVRASSSFPLYFIVMYLVWPILTGVLCSLFWLCLWFVSSSTAECEGCADTAAWPGSPQGEGAGETGAAPAGGLFQPEKPWWLYSSLSEVWKGEISLFISLCHLNSVSALILIWSGFINEIYCSLSLPESFSVCYCQTALSWAWSCKTPWPLGQWCVTVKQCSD